MSGTWTKFKDRLPVEDMKQVFILWKDGSVVISGRRTYEKWDIWFSIMEDSAMSWHPIEYPAPPKEPTQEEKDIMAYYDWHKKAQWDTGGFEWHAALAYERAEVLKLVAPYADNREADESLKAIRARCTP